MTELNKLILGDTLATLESLPDDIVNVGGTSPPTTNRRNTRGGW